MCEKKSSLNIVQQPPGPLWRPPSVTNIKIQFAVKMMLYAILFILRSDPESAAEDETVTETPDVCHRVMLPSAGGVEVGGYTTVMLSAPWNLQL